MSIPPPATATMGKVKVEKQIKGSCSLLLISTLPVARKLDVKLKSKVTVVSLILTVVLKTVAREDKGWPLLIRSFSC